MGVAGRVARSMLQSTWRESLQDATLVLREKDGEEVTLGRGTDPAGPRRVVLEIREPRFYSRTLSMGSLGLGEAWMDHDFEVVEGDLADFLAMLIRNGLKHKSRRDPIFVAKYLAILARNRLRGDAGNSEAHYDIGMDLYEVMLDSALLYTCGYAKHPDDDLEALQQNKLERICQKLELVPGQTVLDLGCGWGGLLIYAAQHYGIHGVGVTNSRTMAEQARARVAAAGLSERVHIHHGDFTEVPGTFDRIVSVGMLEHIRESRYDEVMGTIARKLRPQGLTLLHFASSLAVKNRHDPFIQKYIFPDSNWPSLAELVGLSAQHGLAILDIENLSRHYALTVRRWREHFEAGYPRLDHTRYDERFRRMWLFYLAWGISAASCADGALVHILLTNDHARPNRLHRV